LSEIVDNTNGSFDTQLEVWVKNANVDQQSFVVRNDGDIQFGDTLRAILSEGGLTGTRTYTLPDTSTPLAGINFAQNWGSFQQRFPNGMIAITDASGNWRVNLNQATLAANRAATIPAITSDGNFAMDNFGNVFSVAQTLNNNLNLLIKDSGGTPRQVAKINSSNLFILGD